MIRDRKRSTYLRCVKAGRRCNFFLNGSLSQESSERTVPIRDFVGRASINAGVEDRCWRRKAARRRIKQQQTPSRLDASLSRRR